MACLVLREGSSSKLVMGTIVAKPLIDWSDAYIDARTDEVTAVDRALSEEEMKAMRKSQEQ